VSQSCVLFQLLRLTWNCMVDDDDAAAVKTDRCAAQQLIDGDILPLLPELLRSFDPATVDAATGNNALHELCRLFTLDLPAEWDYELAELFIAHGVLSTFV